jgi:two-component system chemotaxis response regulator CheB
MFVPKDPVYHLNIGEIILSPKPSIISTVLGSCVSVCLFSPTKKMGGMIHYAHPKRLSEYGQDEDYRYGDIAIPALVEELEAATGESSNTFVAKVVGGASEIAGAQSGFDIGSENIKMAKTILNHYGIKIVSEDTGGSLGRKVLFHTATHRLQVAIISPSKETQAPQKQKRKVLIVDDSKTIRELLKRILSEDPDFEIIGTAADAKEASNFLKKDTPHVITLDIHMPGMTGVDWLEQLLPKTPIPVVMISSLQLQEGNEVFRALELGAIDYIKKPTLSELPIVGPIIREKVKEASFSKVVRSVFKRNKTVSVTSGELDLKKILAIGASTGGTEALKVVMAALPEKIPPTVIVQHIPPVFSKAFADRLNELCPFEVKEAEDGDELRPSRVLIAPGGKQMKIQQTSKGLCVRITDDEPVNRHKPSVDYLFYSVASIVGKNSVGVILTGMGNDGAKGLLDMKKKGSKTIAQDENTSVVYGMPKVAFEIGAVEKVAPLENISKEILTALGMRKSA